MKRKFLFCICCIALMLTGCHTLSLTNKAAENTWEDSGYVTIGHNLTVDNADDRLTLLENKDTLSAEGLYYATWTMGDSKPFENSDGDTVDLYDAHLYLLLGEYPSSEQARNNMEKWLTTGKNNYEIIKEEEITRNGQAYTMISYHFANEENPYDRGVSAFGIHDKNAVCIELTCQESFEEDLQEIMLQFLDNCSYSK